MSIFKKDDITENDIKKLIENKVEESSFLDFKDSRALGISREKMNEIRKDVSAFANSAGGVIIYGISEKEHVADELSFINGNEFTKEWIEHVIHGGIQRRINDLKISPVRFDGDILKSVYVINIPESDLAPHMTLNKKYYKRYDFQSVQMEEYEIRQLYNRKNKTLLKIEKLLYPENQRLERDFHDVILPLGVQIKNEGNSIETHFKVAFSFNFEDFGIKTHISAKRQPLESVDENSVRSISLQNDAVIFPNESVNIGYVDFLFKYNSVKSFKHSDKKLKIKLWYTNGAQEAEFDLNNLNLKGFS